MDQRETLTEYPTTRLPGRWAYINTDGESFCEGAFEEWDQGILFHADDGMMFQADEFETGESFRPLLPDADRIAALEAENAGLRERVNLAESAVTVIANDLGNIRQSLGARDGESTVDAAARVGAELATLRAQLAAAKALRLGRGPTAEELEKHGDHGKWLAKPRDTTLGWVLRISKTIRDYPDLYTDAIALTDAGQPCPVGGWGETP